jgi:aspartate aminotransferase
MTGWRLGWAVMPPALVERVHLLMVHTIGCSANFTQVAGAAALDGPRDGLDSMLEEYRKRRDYVCDRLNTFPGVTCATPAGAFYAFPNIAATGLSCEEFASRSLHEAGVAILAGTDFGAGGAGHVRISYVRSLDVLEDGLDKLEAFIIGLPT